MSLNFTSKKVMPSTPVEGGRRGKKLILKAANDNRAPLSIQLKKFIFTLAPIAALSFFAAVWWIS